jgi:anthranilate synthase/aminodeoxychorismate synthase-like glutamine amidotransferase
MIFLIDNYDSFAHNLARYLVRLDQHVVVARNDQTSVQDVRRLRPDAIVISPGPCTPAKAGCSLDIVRDLAHEVPILGVCLGHQAIAAGFGGTVVRAPCPVHGQASQIHHNGKGVFDGLPSPLLACRYHSLVVDENTLPAEFQITARTGDGVVMGIQHRELPVVGLQFHPESILTEHGFAMLANFFHLIGMDMPNSLPSFEDELCVEHSDDYEAPDSPVTF